MEIRGDLHEFQEKIFKVESFLRLFERIQRRLIEDKHYVDTLLTMDYVFEDSIENFKKCRTIKFQKSGWVSKQCLDRAHQNFQNALKANGHPGYLLSAVEAYNVGLCCEYEDSPEIALGYWGRMKVLYELKSYDECFKNMELALRNCPKPLADPLEEMGSQCLLRLKDVEEIPKPVKFRLVSDQHPALSNISSFLNVEDTEVMGRTITTRENIEPAKLIATEEPFLRFLLPHERYRRCAYCLKENYYTMIPCKNCTCTMYCSETCQYNGHKSHHRYECDIVDGLHEIFGRYTLAIYAALAYFDKFDNIQEAQNFFYSSENSNRTVFETNGLEAPPGSDFHKLRALQGLQTHEESRSVEIIATLVSMAMVAKHLLLTYTDLQIKVFHEADRHFFSRLLYHYFMVCDIYAVDITQLNAKDKKIVPYGCGLYLFSGLLNHSCVPNAIRVYKGAKCMVFTIRPIQAENEIFVAYRSHNFYDIPRSELGKSLYKQFFFICKCPACWEQYIDYQRFVRDRSDKEVLPDDKIKIEHIFNGYQHTFEKAKFTTYQKILNEYEEDYPCKEAIEHSIAFEMDLYCALGNVRLEDRLFDFQAKAPGSGHCTENSPNPEKENSPVKDFLNLRNRTSISSSVHELGSSSWQDVSDEVCISVKCHTPTSEHHDNEAEKESSVRQHIPGQEKVEDVEPHGCQDLDIVPSPENVSAGVSKEFA